MRNVIFTCIVTAGVALAAASPVLARGGGGGGGGGHGGGGGGGGHFGGGGGGGHFGGGGGRGPMMGGGGPMMRGGGPMMGGGSFRSNAMVGGPRFSRANLNRNHIRFDRFDRFNRFDRRHDRFRFRRNAFFFGVGGDGYYDYAYACPIVTARYVRGGRVFYRDVRQCDYY